MKLYRYRKISSALPEIENTSFRLAAKSELNDPIEGYLNLYWNGDKPAWEGLLRNYICSLYIAIEYTYVFKDKYNVEYYAVIPDLRDLKDSDDQEHIRIVADQFLNLEDTETVIKYLSECNEIKRDMLEVCLVLLHETAYRLCMAELKKTGDLPEKIPESYVDMHQVISALSAIKTDENVLDELSNVVNHEKTSLLGKSLIGILKKSETDMDFAYKKNLLDVRFDFPKIYVNRLRELVYPKMFIACFSTEMDNSVMWGNYADSHKGVCLIYESDENNCLKLENKPQEDGGGGGVSKVKLRPVRYGGEITSRNFFESMGRFTKSASDTWLTGKDGSRSNCFHPSDYERWQKRYWLDLENIYNRKMEEWSYEKEYRIIKSGFYGSPNATAQTFRFIPEQLKGIIFGIKTSLIDKSSVISAVRKAYGSSNQIQWFQADYNESKQKIEIFQISV